MKIAAAIGPKLRRDVIARLRMSGGTKAPISNYPFPRRLVQKTPLMMREGRYKGGGHEI
jgi:hypothetical protein